MEEAKPKRKYTRKPKVVVEDIEDVVEDVVEQSSTKPKRKYTRKPKVVIEEPKPESEPEPEPVGVLVEAINNFTLKPLSRRGIFIYYKGSDPNVLKFIQDFQGGLEVGSQIMVLGNDQGFKIDNCFYSDPDNDIEWFKLCYFRDATICIRIKELPSYEHYELLKKIEKDDTFEDSYVEVIII